MIDMRQMAYEKPVLIIYNPRSGTKRNLRDQIREQLDGAKIPYELYETKGPRDSFYHALRCELSQYSAITAVGGDGTVHEVVDGMMKRKDGLRVPLWIIPNGSGNTIAMNYKCMSVEDSFTALKKGHAIKTDVLRVLLDHETVQEVPADKLETHCFYALGGAMTGFGCRMVDETSQFMKNTLGQFAYFITIYRLILEGQTFVYDLELDGREYKKGYRS